MDPDRVGRIRLRHLEPFRAAALTTRGPYWKLSGPLSQLRSWIETQGMRIGGHLIGIFYDDPAETPPEDSRFTLAYPVEADKADTLNSPADSEHHSYADGDVFDMRDFPRVLAAVLRYEGPARESPSAYAELDRWMKERGYRRLEAPREKYLAEPGSLTGGLMRVEIQQPVVREEQRSRERRRR